MSNSKKLSVESGSLQAGPGKAAGAENATPGRECRLTGKIGLITTWNQECGLATYARYLLSDASAGSYTVLAEDTDIRISGEDESFVERCWQRDSDDWSQLEAAVFRNEIGLLHINAQPVFFNQPSFSHFLSAVRSKQVRVVLHLHNIYTMDARVQALVQVVDAVIVHTAENRLEAIANGASAESVFVVPHGVDIQPELSQAERSELRSTLGLSVDEKMVLCFGFIQPHKGVECLIESVVALTSSGVNCRGFVAGKPNEDDPGAREYMLQLRKAVTDCGIDDRVVFFDRFLSNDEVTQYLQAADVVLMNYRSQHYEASGACSLAVGAGAVVATSIAPPFAAFGDAVWHITSGFPSSLSLNTLLTNTALQSELKQNARRYAEKNSWEQIWNKLLVIYSSLGFQPCVNQKENIVEQEDNRHGKSDGERALRVLVQNRPNTFSQRGGDTIVLERTVDGLKSKGVAVDVDLEGKVEPAGYDIVHLFNFAMPDMVRVLGERAQRAGVPFVVTTLCEDVPSFHNQSIAYATTLIEYVQKGQEPGWWSGHRPEVELIEGCEAFDNQWTAQNAAALFTNGARETQVVKSTYGTGATVIEIPLGYEVGARGNPALFINEYGVKDFVFCVGRFESRKNQLMLLKALEHVDLPVVLASGGFTYQPDYDAAVRNFKRNGQTVILERVSMEMLASAYAAARIHALPSWYELPGLVSLEAAYHDCNVVVADRGTSRDYLAEDAFYCEPTDEDSIKNAVIAAYYSPVPATLKERVVKNTWESIAETTLNAYGQVLGRVVEGKRVQQPQSAQVSAGAATDLCPNLSQGEEAARNKDYATAHELLDKALVLNPDSIRALRAKAAVLLAEQNADEARKYFMRSYQIDTNDAKTLSGLGMSHMLKSEAELAYPYFVRAVEIDKEHVVGILQLIECAYVLDRYGDLHTVLSDYVARHPEDKNMKFCLAGCVYKTGDLAEALRLADELLQSSPNDLNAGDLRSKIIEEMAAGAQIAAEPAAQNDPVKPQPTQQAGAAAGRLQDALSSLKTAANTTAAEVNPSPATRQPAVAAQPLQQPSASPASRLQQALSSLQEAAAGGAPAGVATEVAPHAQADTSGGDAQMIENRLQEALDLKRAKKYDEALEVCAEVKANTIASAAQIEHAELTEAEVTACGGDLDTACQIFERVYSDNPRAARALCGLGAIAGSREQWDEAHGYFERALTIEPENDVALAGLGVYAAQQQDLATAWSYYRRALDCNPENSRALLGLIEVGYAEGRYVEIGSAVESYLEMHPGDLNMVYSLAGCYYAQGRIDEALSEVNKITIFEPHNEKALELKKMIDERVSGDVATSRQVS